MKRKVVYLVVMSISLLILVASSGFKFKNVRQEKMLVGKWKFLNYLPNENIIDKNDEEYDKKYYEAQEFVMKSLKDAYIEFNEDHTFTNYTLTQSKNGIWSLSEDGLTLTTTNTGEKSRIKKIILLTNETLEYKSPNPKGLDDIFHMEKFK